uniref:Putative conserved tubulin-tyrosine ligase-like protein n=1 Tax=Trypanosoma vivax (strain Y486) TaxID=1055687 RepID=G0TX26_TRYVY|nr:putative conserved tubulin-tyrosine ligase-like protein [Trypanosoma vivax Y486]
MIHRACTLLVPIVARTTAGVERQHQTVHADLPVYLKPSRSSRRKPSFFFPRMRDGLPSYAFRAPPLGPAIPLFHITSPSCEYYALRIAVVKAGFKRLQSHLASSIPCNLFWGRSMTHESGIEKNASSNVDRPRVSLPLAAMSEREESTRPLEMVCSHQRFNHFPGTYANIGCKLGLTMRLRHVAKSLDKAGSKHELYNFVPRTWIFPQEKELLVNVLAQASPNQRFIWKPARGSCGRGIFVCAGGAKNAQQWKRVISEMEARFAAATQATSRSYVVQDYIDDPFLLDGRKTDLRLYVAVTSFDPLVVYLHNEGLVRLAAQGYSEGAVNSVEGSHVSGNSKHSFDPFRDLTNYSVGRKWLKRIKQSDNKEEVGDDTDPSNHEEIHEQQGLNLKKSLPDLWDHIDSLHPTPLTTFSTEKFPNTWPPGRASDRVRDDIAKAIVKTLLTVKAPLVNALNRCPSPGGFFELYGFDMMLDAKLKPWLVEVNTLPSLASTSPLDYSVKTNIITDILNLAMIEPFARPVECFGNASDSTPLQRAGLFDPLSTEAAGSVHSWTDCHTKGRKSLPLDDNEAREELWLRLEDELAYARGFRRIFPPPRTSFPNPPILEELRELGPHVRLTKADVWALES